MELDIHSYDYYVVTFSGGKDSTATFLHLLDLGVPKEKIELWHHVIDPADAPFMDWEVTEDYCRKFAQAFGVRLYFSGKQGGFEGELLRKDSLTQPNWYETPDGVMVSGGRTGKLATRWPFPQVSKDLSVRWCSAYLKIDVGKAALVNQPRFNHRRTLLISGERAGESTSPTSGRAAYAYFEPDTTDKRDSPTLRRHVDRCRLVHPWSEADVWGIIQRWGVVVHPCYYLGYSRCSCKWCIFGDADQFATSYYLSPDQGEKIIRYEYVFNTTIKHHKSVAELLQEGTTYRATGLYPEKAAQAISKEYTGAIFTTAWTLPAGAFQKDVGPL
jgi:3'-phosphoadenosine 5'-phosphosulfate sulfotransferase (PAPS reductase)/FAD synthetase